MSDVKRWEPENTIVGYNMKPGAGGSFVLSCDYDAMKSRLDNMRARLELSAAILDEGIPADTMRKIIKLDDEAAQ